MNTCIGRASSTLTLAFLLWAGGAQADEPTNPGQDKCLLRAVREAPPATTVAELRQRCAEAGVTPGAASSSAIPPDLTSLLSTPPAERSLVERRTVSELHAMGEPFALLPHRPNYLLPLSYHHRSAGSAVASSARDNLETQFQISFKFALTQPLFDGRLIPFFAYTGRAWWQAFDGQRSRPFREYNHEPELLLAMPAAGIEWLGWKHRLTIVGLNHQSNGLGVPNSRSWNRLSAEWYLDRGRDTWSTFKIWRRFKEGRKTEPGDSNGDDNPDITRYLGHFEWRLGHASPDGHNFTATIRHALRHDGRGALQLDWSHPSSWSPHLRGYVQVFSGYGDSLIDYNVKINRVGVGVMLNDWF
jgi:phospholipase A1/A2